MKSAKYFILLILIWSSTEGSAQNKRTITYQKWQDMPQDTYVRIMHTADSLLEVYQIAPFNFENKNGQCCLKGLLVIKEFYSRALIEQPNDEDAKAGIEKVNELMEDEELLYEEKQFGKILARGDYYYDKGYFKKALIFYQRADSLSPKSKTIKKKIKQAKKQIKKYKKI